MGAGIRIRSQTEERESGEESNGVFRAGFADKE